MGRSPGGRKKARWRAGLVVCVVGPAQGRVKVDGYVAAPGGCGPINISAGFWWRVTRPASRGSLRPLTPGRPAWPAGCDGANAISPFLLKAHATSEKKHGLCPCCQGQLRVFALGSQASSGIGVPAPTCSLAGFALVPTVLRAVRHRSVCCDG